MRHVALILAALTLGLGAASLHPPAPRAPDAATRGVALGLFATDPDYDYAVLLEELRARGATDVLIVVNWYQRDVRAHDIAPRAGKSPSAPTVARTLRQARQLGLRVALMPVVRLRERAPDQWRGVISAPPGPWFASYGAFVDEMARVAEREGARRLVVGSELASMLRHEDRWRALIARTRRVFSGELWYSANWDNYARVGFWDALDGVGLTAYFELAAPGERATDADLARRWRAIRGELAALRRAHGKPVVLTELGYPSRAGAAARPWDEHGAGEPDLEVQARLYEAACDGLAPYDAVDGLYFWNWFGVGGPRDASYTPRGKPAAAHMEACLRRADWNAPTRGDDR